MCKNRKMAKMSTMSRFRIKIVILSLRLRTGSERSEVREVREVLPPLT